jgi:hypothetical protein
MAEQAVPTRYRLLARPIHPVSEHVGRLRHLGGTEGVRPNFRLFLIGTAGNLTSLTDFQVAPSLS